MKNLCSRSTILWIIFFSLLIFEKVLAQQNQTLSTSIQLALNRNKEIEIENWNNKLAIIELQRSKIRPNPVFNAQILMLTNHRFYPDNSLYISPYNRQDWFQLTKRCKY